VRLLSLRTVLVATDLMPAARPALATAAGLAEAAGGTLHVAHVSPASDAVARDARRADCAREIDAAITHGGHVSNERKIHLLGGEAPAAIASLADRIGADLIVLGRGGDDERIRHGQLGSTAYDVITRVTAPCLVVRRPLPLPLGNVLVAIDFSESARGALLVALSWASALRSRNAAAARPTLLALHVDTHAAADDEHANETMERELGLVKHSAGGWSGVKVQGVTQQGEAPVRGIIDYSVHHAVDLVVLGTRGLTIGAGSNLGSISEGVTRQLDVPVLLVPPAIWRNYAKDLDAA